MPTYSAIATSELAVNKPITSSLMTRMRDNPLAIFEQLGWAVTGSVAVSPEQTITFGGTITYNHGLTAITNGYDVDIMLYLICQTAEGGYGVGDVVPYTPSGRDVNMSVIVSTTAVVIRYGSSSMLVTNASTGADFSITAANWKLRIKARG